MVFIMRYLQLLLLLCVSFTSYAQSETSYAKVITFAPIKIGETVDISGKFEGISQGARKLGLGDSLIEGTVNYTDLGQNKTRVAISWHTLRYKYGDFSENEPLSPQLITKIISDGDVDPNTTLTIKGDLNNVLKSFKRAKNRAEAKSKNSTTFTENNITDDAQDADSVAQVAASDFSPSSSGGGTSNGSTGGSDSNPTTTNNNLTPNVDLQSTEKVACSPRIDEAGGFVYKQEKTITSAGGEQISESGCSDTGLNAPITSSRNDCGILPDFDNNRVFLEYKKIAELESENIQVKNCAVDINTPLSIDRSFTDCGVRNDFIANVAIQQEQLSYLEGANKLFLNDGDCGDSTLTYTHYLTDQTCDVTVDSATNTVFIQQRVAYNNNSGQVEYAGDCAPISTNTVTILKEFCADKYEHDFLNNVSYVKEKSYYNHPSNGKTFLTDCIRSTSVSYPHSFQSSNCTVKNDDTALRTTFRRKRFINTNDDGAIEIAGCQDFSNPVAYVPLSAAQTKTFERKINTFFTTFNSKFAKCEVPSSLTVHPLITPRIEGGCVVESDTGAFECSCTVYETNWSLYQNYLRGDGSNYKKLLQKITKIAG